MIGREDRYRTINKGCGTADFYSPRHHKIMKSYCGQFTCGRCRTKGINNKMKDVIKIANDYKLYRHLVITLKGKSFRGYISPDDSFKYCSNKWNNLRNAYIRKYKSKFPYLVFFRSQQDGYAHMHILVGVKLEKEWLWNILEKINLGMASLDFIDIHRIKNYLSKYWYKEHEWFIPENKRHFSSSRDIKFEKYKPQYKDYILLVAENYYIPYNKLECYYNIIEENYGYPPPLDFILGEFYNKIKNN